MKNPNSTNFLNLSNVNNVYSRTSHFIQKRKPTKEVSLMKGVILIIGHVIGAGIFISPVGVLKYTGSYGLSLILWSFGGLFSIIGAMCFAELGTTITKSGASYIYIMEIFGRCAAFIKLWASLLLIEPSLQAITALTFANYLVQPIFSSCDPPFLAVQLLAAASISLITFTNCAYMKWGSRVEILLTYAKMISLIIIIIAGIIKLIQEKHTDLISAFDGSSWKVDSIVVSLYFTLFSYSGWDILNYMIKEIKNPGRNLPLAIVISLPLVTILYVLTILAFYAVLQPNIILKSGAVAVAFAEESLGIMRWIIPTAVAITCFENLNAAIRLTSRMYLVGGREGQLPALLTLTHINRLTPIPALITNASIALVYLSVGDVFKLIFYYSFSYWFFVGVTVCAQLYLRWQQPNKVRTLKLSLIYPITFCVGMLFLIIVPTYSFTSEAMVGISVMLSGIPVYLIGSAFIQVEWYSPFIMLLGTYVLFLPGSVASESEDCGRVQTTL
uniref:Solute carrier family 7 member 6 n=1 Tax=Callorhinchus milii TaxID=7868 RepID=A0A4W3HVN5_CALMI